MNIFITGGAGFIGSNAAAHFLKNGHKVTVFDNLSRRGSKSNLKWLESLGKKLKVQIGDVRKTRDFDNSAQDIKKADVVLHLAAQVAVTTSVHNPKEDFDINAAGTLNLLEYLRKTGSKAKCIYASTNKVYGSIEDVEVIEGKTRYTFKKKLRGITESQILDFHSPYGCSKGAADQYVHDFSRIYGLDTVVFRQSCIYGPRQFGVEDQGWLAWFMIAEMLGRPITIYGNGKQVRDVLYIDDLLEAYELVIKHADRTKGKIYNIGGGMDNSISVWFEFGPILEKLLSKKIKVKYSRTRPGDQPLYISDISKAGAEFAWKPKTSVSVGTAKLFDWIHTNRTLFR